MSFIIEDNKPKFVVGKVTDKNIDLLLNRLIGVDAPQDLELSSDTYLQKTNGYWGNVVTFSTNQIEVGSILPHLQNTILTNGILQKVQNNIDSILQNAINDNLIKNYSDLEINIDNNNKLIIKVRINNQALIINL